MTLRTSPPRDVYWHAHAVFNAAGTSADDMHTQRPEPVPLPFSERRYGHPALPPKLPSGSFDRKVLRSVEAQGVRLLHCAAQLAPLLQAQRLPARRVMIGLAAPQVDAASPAWDAVAAMKERPHRWLSEWLSNTPPLHALTMLNSSVVALLAESLNCTGPVAGYCGQEHAGLDALFEAWHALRDNRCDGALVVTSSPNLTPALLLRGPPVDHDGAELLSGEGAAATLLTAEPPQVGPIVKVAGLSRGYVPPDADEETRQAVFETTLTQALSTCGMASPGLRRVWTNGLPPSLRKLLPGVEVRFASRPHVGALGASQPITDAAYALSHPIARTDQTFILLQHDRAGYLGAMVLTQETAS